MLLVSVGICLKSALIYNFYFSYLSSGHCLLREQGRDDPLSFFGAKLGPRARTFGKHDGRRSVIVMVMFIQQQQPI
jgi:hypothetical protein